MEVKPMMKMRKHCGLKTVKMVVFTVFMLLWLAGEYRFVSAASATVDISTKSTKVEKGDVCRNISIALQELNIIEDAEDFRKYMGKKGYASSIHTGEFKIPKDATYDEIAKILIKK